MATPPSSIAHALPPNLNSFKPAKPHAFNPSTEIPSQAGKVILITGGNTGIGKQAALELAKHGPAQILIAARNSKTGIEAVSAIKSVAPDVAVRFVECDLASFASIKSAAKTILAEANRLDILLLNSGILGGPPTTTAEGYEMQFGTNHVGHALLLRLLTPLLLATEAKSTATPRIICTSSRGHKSALPVGGIAFDTLKSAQPDIMGISKYTQSKLANVVYARQVAKHYPNLISIAIHPEDVATELFNKGIEGGGPEVAFLAKEVAPKVGVSVEEGAKNGLWACTADGVESGRYYEPVGVLGNGSDLSKDQEFGKKLWDWTERKIEGVTL